MELLPAIRHAMPAAGARGVEYAPHLEAAATRWHITDNRWRAASWLANIAHESRQLTAFHESMWYSAPRLVEVWESRFYLGAPVAGKHDAKAYAGREEALANLVYASRLGNGNEASGDGWRFRGRGPAQLTGRGAYAAFGAAIGADLETHPECLEDPHFGAMSAAWFFAQHKPGLLQLADARQFDVICSRWQGATPAEGIASRREFYEALLEVLP